MIILDGYSIEHYPNSNQIVITMPQTTQTITNTIEKITNRRTDITHNELTALLVCAKAMVEKE